MVRNINVSRERGARIKNALFALGLSLFFLVLGIAIFNRDAEIKTLRAENNRLACMGVELKKGQDNLLTAVSEVRSEVIVLTEENKRLRVENVGLISENKSAKIDVQVLEKALACRDETQKILEEMFTTSEVEHTEVLAGVEREQREVLVKTVGFLEKHLTVQQEYGDLQKSYLQLGQDHVKLQEGFISLSKDYKQLSFDYAELSNAYAKSIEDYKNFVSDLNKDFVMMKKEDFNLLLKKK